MRSKTTDDSIICNANLQRNHYFEQDELTELTTGNKMRLRWKFCFASLKHNSQAAFRKHKGKIHSICAPQRFKINIFSDGLFFMYCRYSLGLKKAFVFSVLVQHLNTEI